MDTSSTAHTQKVSVIGLGYVGLPLSLLADMKGYTVFGIDLDAKKVDLINKRISPQKDERTEEELKTTKLVATTDFAKVSESDIVVICVPTPVYENHMPNLEPVKGACEAVAANLKKGALVVLESTVNPGVTEEIVIPIFQKHGLEVGKDFYIAHCPERINPGDAKWTVRNIPRVVGASDAVGLQKALDFYSSVVEANIMPMGSLKEAESVKVVENSFRDINIAFVNELAMSFSKLGIDVVNVIKGAATKPFAFMPHFPGVGVGGHCIPVDPYYLIEYAKENGFEHDFLRLARRINSHMPAFTVDLLVRELNKLGLSTKNAKVALLGLSYKADIDDCRESPSFVVIELLKELGIETKIFDPYVAEFSTVSSFDEALQGVDAVIVATPHKVFIETLTPENLKKQNVKLVVDGRNCLEKDMFASSGIIYIGIGR